MFQSEMNKEHKNPFPVFISFTSYFQLHMLKCKIQQKKKSWEKKKIKLMKYSHSYTL